MEKIGFIQAAIVAILTTFSGAAFNRLFNASLMNRRRKKSFNAEELSKLKEYFKEEDQAHFESFILSTHKEEHFYAETGIRTNYLSIPKYIDLKNRLGGNYNWQKIKSAMMHFNLDSEQIEIKRSKIQVLLMKSIIAIAFLLILGGTIAMSIVDYSDELKTKLALLFITLTLFLLGLMLIKALDPIHTAYHMRKRRC
ncbi:MAG: hypothetical protein JEZ14_20990 [Marinilabiliaceae bacterium]|nr:hypothetical protein [Marinilabiliaceae bacterium]